MRHLLAVALILLALPSWAAHPELFNRTADNTKLATMKADYEADADCTTSPTTVSSAACQPATYGGRLYKLIHDNSAGDNRYSDNGQWGAIMYKATGTAAYATQSFGEVTVDFLPVADASLCGNFSREYFVQFVLIYDWTYNALDGTQRTDFLNKLKNMANLCTVAAKFRPGDGDQEIGDYFGMALLKLAEPADSTIDTYWTTENATRKLGSFTSTASDGATRRNAIRFYIDTMGVGGEWPEASQYNIGTVKLAILGAEAVRSSRGGDDYPEITTWVNEACEQIMQSFTPGINEATSQRHQWSDDENPRTLRSFAAWETASMLAGACVGMAAGPRMQDFVLDWLDSSSVSGIDPWPRFAFMFDPYATRGDHTTSVKARFASGVGMLSSRTGWTGSDAVFWPHLQSWRNLPNTVLGSFKMDHSPTYWGEFQLWAEGEYKITHPITYAGPSLDSRASNGLSVGGVPVLSYYGPREYRGTPVWEQSDVQGYTYFTGTMGGSIEQSVSWGLPSTFVMEHTRSFMWLPGKHTLLIHDRANSKDPTVTGTVGYNAALKAYLDTLPAVKSLWVHSQFVPSLQSGYIGWTLASGDQVRVNHLLPTSITRTVENEVTVFSGAYYGLGYWDESEKDWHVRISPTSTQQWDTFLNCWDYDAGTPVACSVVQDTTNKVDCALLTLGTTNTLTCFNALQGQDIPNRTVVSGFGYYAPGVSAILDVVRKRVGSFTLVFTAAGGTTTKAILADLDTSKTWTYQINGGGSVGLTPSAAGIGIIDLTETGSVTLAVATAGIADLAITTTSPLQTGTQNVAYSTCVAATGGVLPYTWTKTAGDYPTGLSLTASTGCVAGTPSGTGLSNFTLQVADSQGTPDTASRAFDLTIAAAATPTLIETTSFPEAAVGVAYSQGITVSGGTPPYTCSLFSGAVPTGMSVNSTCGTVLTGTPTVPDQNTSFTLRACDSAGTPVCDDQAFTLHVSFLISFVTQLELQHLGATAVTGRIGAIGLPYETDCSVTITGVSPASTTEGSGRRTFVIAGLTADTQYDVVGECVYAAFASQSSLITFRTLPAPSGGDRTVPITLKASSVLSTAARVTVDYDDNPALSTPVSVQNPSCASGCTVNLTIPAGLYYYRWRWQTSGDVVLATSAIQPLMVQ